MSGLEPVLSWLKWDSTERSRNQFSFDAADKYVNLARQNGQMLRCHTLLWHNQVPGWVKSGNFNNKTMADIIRNHVTKVVSHFKGKCYAWDVVNEALEEDGSYRKSVFFNAVGEQYIPIAFKAAAQADPGARLYYNDYNMESPWASKKMAGAKRIIKLIKVCLKTPSARQSC
jgi:endo-1,4-beta-xylanase